MKVESIIKRNPPTSITLGDTAYQFEIDSEDRHVCEVSDEQHLARLLSIPEGYRLVLEKGQKAPDLSKVDPIVPAAAPTVQPTEPELKGSGQHPDTIDLGGDKTIALADVIKLAFEASKLDAEAWNALRDDERADHIDGILDGLAEEDGNDEANDDDKLAKTRAQLADEYEKKFGKKPHGKWTVERITEELKKDAQ